MTTTTTRRAHTYALGPGVLRRAWAAVTHDPGITVRALAQRLRVSPGHAHAALRALRDAGYIEYEDGTRRARRVVVGLYPQRRTR